MRGSLKELTWLPQGFRERPFKEERSRKWVACSSLSSRSLLRSLSDRRKQVMRLEPGKEGERGSRGKEYLRFGAKRAAGMGMQNGQPAEFLLTVDNLDPVTVSVECSVLE
jgi:hypothetical protein